VPSSGTDPRIGTILADRYFIHSLIGEGGMGKVYAGEHVLMHKRVAVKVLHKALTTLPDVVQRFEREAMAAANIDDPNVAAATDFGHLPEGLVFIVLEYVQGTSLRSEIADGPFGVSRALHIARQMASALASAHARGIVHRDLKPENVMLVEKAGDPDFVKVFDFGIAKVPIQEISEQGSVRPGEIITKVGMIFGTPEYMAPEQALAQDTDGRADQYALGVVLFEMLTGHRPFPSNSQVGILAQQLKGPPPKVSDKVPTLGIPAEVESLVDRLLAVDRDQRFDSALELVVAIEELLLEIQPALLIRGSRPDASQGPLSRTEGPISSRLRGRHDASLEVSLEERSVPKGGLLGIGLPGAVARVYRRLQRTTPHKHHGLPAQLVLALMGGLLVGATAVAIGLIVVALRAEPEVGRRHLAPNAVPSVARAATWSPTPERSPAAALSMARANGAVALDALAQQYPHDPSIVVELAKGQFASGEFPAAVGSIDRALVIDKSLAKDAEIASLLWKLVQKRECNEPAFKLLEGVMGARGADIIYDLATTAGVRRDIKLRADEYFASGRYRVASSPELALLMTLRNAANCAERRRAIEQAASLGDERFLPLLEALQDKSGCGPHKRDDCNSCLRPANVLEHSTTAIRQRAGPE